jgi:hypothetical protein
MPLTSGPFVAEFRMSGKPPSALLFGFYQDFPLPEKTKGQGRNDNLGLGSCRAMAQREPRAGLKHDL